MTTAKPRQAPAGRGPVEARLPRTAQPERADQKGRQPAERAGPHRGHLRQAGLRQHRQAGSARPDALVGPLYPARAGLRRHLDRRREPRSARGEILHAAGALRRRRAVDGGAAHARRNLDGVRARHRRHLRPGERAVPLDPDRGHAGDLEAAGRGRAADHRGVRRLPPGGPRFAAGRRLTGRGARRHACDHEIVRRYIGKPEYANLPRKFKTAISGLQDVCHEVNDVAFIGVNHPEHGPGFDLWVGGGLSTNPMLGQRVGAWVPLDEVPDVWEAVVSVFRDYGYRRLRAKARLKFLIKDWGVEKFREVLEQEYLKRPLIDGPAPDPVTRHDRPRRRAEAQERAQRCRRRPDRRPGVGHHPVEGGRPGRRGRLGPHPVHAVSEADRAGRARRQGRRTASPALTRWACRRRPSHWRKNLMACTGIEFCKLSFAETRKRSQVLVPELEKRLEDINAQLDVPITININGCPNSCARIQVADIGFKGQMVDDGDGPGRGFPGAPGRQPGPGQRVRPQVASAQGAVERAGRLHRPGCSQLRETTRARRAFRYLGGTSRRGGFAMSTCAMSGEHR